MTTFVTFALAACLLAQTGTTEAREPEAEINWPTNVDADTYFNSRLPISRLAATPKWEADDENPPLSARKAIAIAEALMKELAPYGQGAKLNAPTLKLRESGGHWFWVVYYSPNDWRQFQTTFPIVVLMDGTAVRPERMAPPPSPTIGP
jgi:hypothetical protein